MSPSQVQRQPATAGPADPLPLRSLTAVWVLLGAIGAVFVVLGVRTFTPAAVPAPSGQGATREGPTKEQVRQRQEHIAITQRAQDLASKERKAAIAAATPAPTSPAQQASTSTAVPAPVGANSETRPAATAAKAAAAQPAAPAAAPAGKAPSGQAEPALTPAKPAAKSGLDAMRADIAADFE